MSTDQKKSKENRGGTGRGAGRVEIPKGEHKKILTIYIEQDYQDLLGGKKELQKDMKAYVYDRVDEALKVVE